MKIIRATIALGLAALVGCASTSDIDMTQVDATCGQKCSANYSACGQQFTMFPIMAQRQCADALKLCVQACPARKPEDQRKP
jgi:hypothetical protein